MQRNEVHLPGEERLPRDGDVHAGTAPGSRMLGAAARFVASANRRRNAQQQLRQRNLLNDGDGNFALSYIAGGSGPNYPVFLFFTIQNGQAVRIGGAVPGGDDSYIAVSSQPSGFTAFHANVFGDTQLLSYDPAGNRIATTPLTGSDSTSAQDRASQLELILVCSARRRCCTCGTAVSGARFTSGMTSAAPLSATRSSSITDPR